MDFEELINLLRKNVNDEEFLKETSNIRYCVSCLTTAEPKKMLGINGLENIKNETIKLIEKSFNEKIK